MLGTGINLQASKLGSAELILGKHAANRHHDDLARIFAHLILEHYDLRPFGVARMPEVELRLRLIAGQLDLSGIGHDDKIAAIHRRGENTLVLAPQQYGSARGETAQNRFIGVDMMPNTVVEQKFSGRKSGF